MTTTALKWPWNIVSAGFRGLGAVAPGLAGRLAFTLFATPRPAAARSKGEQQLLDEAERLVIPHGGRTLAGYAWGTGPTVLLVHGWESRAGRMRAFVRPLVRRGYRVVAFDGPAHGESPGRRTTLPEFSEGVRAAARVAAPLHAIVAHSFGAAATMHALTQYPEIEVGRVILSGSPSELELMVSQFASRLRLTEPVVAGIHRQIERLAGLTVEEYSVARGVGGLTVPGLVIHDRDDEIVPFQQGEAIAHAWPTATLLATERLGHRGVIRSPEVIRAVLDFITRAVDEPARSPLPA